MTTEMLGRLARRELAPDEIEAVLRHAAGCADCSRLASEMTDGEAGRVQAMLAAEAELFEHPAQEELVAYVDRKLGPVEREILDTHLEDCPRCSTDVGDLVALSRNVRPHRPRWRVALTAAAAAAVAAVVILQRSDDPKPVAPTPAPRPVITETVVPAPPTSTHPPVSTATVQQKPRYAKAEWERMVATAITSGVLPFPKDFAQATDTLRGENGEAATRLTPSGVYVDDTTPKFSWPARDGATYVVSIFENGDELATSEPLTSTSWTPTKPLARGRTFIWQVEATIGGERSILPAPPAPPAMFRVVSQKDHDDLALARREHPDDHALHAVLAARAGLRDEAAAAWKRAKQ